MEREALRQAWDRLHKAEVAHAALIHSTSLWQMDSAWSDFLTAANTVYSKLEAGSRGHSKSEPWFGGIKHQRRTDELLSYIHHARNCDEHGFDRVTKYHGGAIAVQGAVEINGSIGPGKRLHFKALDEKNGIKVVVTQPQVKLVRVFDNRHKDWFEVPTSHLGNPLEDQSPMNVATLALNYLKRVVTEAGNFAKGG